MIEIPKMKVRKQVINALAVAVVLLSGGLGTRAGVISVNLTTAANDQQQINADETFGIAAEGTVVGGWQNFNQVLNNPNLLDSAGNPTTVGMTGTAPGGWNSFNTAYADTPLLGGMADYTTTPTPTTVTITNLNANFPNGYKIIVYVVGFLANTGASISDGTSTFYYRPLSAPTAPVTFVQTTTTTDLGAGNAPVAQYAVFGSPTLLTANSVTLTLNCLYGAGAGFGGFQIVGETTVERLTRTWTGSQSTAWDTLTANWSSPFFASTNYSEGCIVVFNDTAAAAAPTVNLTGTRSPLSVTVDGSKDYTFTGSGISGATGLIKKSAGLLTLVNSNSYSGHTVISSGTLKVGLAGAIPDGVGKGDVSIASGATLDLNGISEGINGLTGAGMVDNSGGAATLTVGLDNENSTFAGYLQGPVTLAKRGTGTNTFAGNSAHSGLTIVQSGVLRLDPVSGFSSSSPLVVSNGATLVLSVTNGSGLFSATGLTLNGGTALSIDYGDANNTGTAIPLTASGTLTLNGVSQIAISGKNFAIGSYTLISYAGKSGTGSISATPASLPPGTVATIVDTGTEIRLVVTSSVQSLLWTAGDGNWSTNGDTFYWNFGTAAYKEYTNGLGDAVQFDTSNSGTVSILHDVHPFLVSVNGNYVLNGPGRITGATGIEKSGSTTLLFTLNSPHSYDGVTKVTAGTLLVTHPGALGSTLGATVVTNGGSLALSNGITLAGEPLILSGDGVTGNNGALRSLDTNNPVTVTSPITLAGDARVRAENGLVNLNGKITDGTGTNFMLTLHSGGIATVRVNSSSNSVSILRTYGFNLSNGRTVFGAPNTFPAARLRLGGGYTDLNGFSQVFEGIDNGSDSANGMLTNTSTTTATLTLAGTNVLVTTVPVAGRIQLLKTGSAIQALNGTNAHTGTTTIEAGILRINSDSSRATNTWLVSGGSLQGSGIIGGPLSVGALGTLEPRAAASSIATLTVSNSLNLAGTLVIELDKGLAQSNDIVNVTGPLVYGGTLVATNIGATPLAVGDKFTVFPPGGSGSFASIVSNPGVTMGFADGVLTVLSITGPTLNYAALGNGVLQFNWTGPYKLQWQTNGLSVGLGTNWVDYPDPANPVNVTNNPAIPASFFRLAP